MAFYLRRLANFRKPNYNQILQEVTKKLIATNSLADQELWVKSPLPTIQIPNNVSLPEYLRATIKPAWNDKIAYECIVTGRKYTYAQIFQMSRSFGASLIQSGIKRGDVVGIVLPNIPEYAAIQFGIWEAGGVASPVNPNYTAEETNRQLNICNAKVAITTPKLVSIIQAKSNGSSNGVESIIVVPETSSESIAHGYHNFYSMIQTNFNSVNFPKFTEIEIEKYTTLLPFSSGTTGFPKGVCLTQYNLLSNMLQSYYLLNNLNPETERLIGVLPFFHSYGMQTFLNVSLLHGASIVCIPKFDADVFLKALKYHKPTTLHLVPPMINLIVNNPKFTKAELASVDLVLVGAAPVGPSLIKRLYEKADKEFIFREGYGMTELSPVTHMLPPKRFKEKIGSCGVPLANTITKIVDVDSGKTLGKDKRGELCIKGPQMMTGYYNNDEATKSTIDSDGWLHTGDIAYYDSDGYCYIVDRLKELIKVKGFQVAPAELEDLLRKNEAISDVAVIGVPHSEMGEVPRAYLVLRNPDIQSSLVTQDSINSFLKDHVSSYKLIRGGIAFVNEIPKAPTGKILRRELMRLWKENQV